MSVLKDDVKNRLIADQEGKRLLPFDRSLREGGDSDAKTNWQFIHGKTDGANDGGIYGGLYKVKYDNGEIGEIYLKKDPEKGKDLGERFASQFMRFIAEEIGENPDMIANVNYVNLVDDEGKDQVYIASEVFAGYRDIFIDAYLAYQLHSYANSREAVGDKWKILPNRRPGYLQHDSCIDNMMMTGRYKDMNPMQALRRILDDPDSNLGNIGAVPIKRSGKDDHIPVIKDGVFTGEFIKKTTPREGAPEEIEIERESYSLFPANSVHPLEEIEEEFNEVCIEHINKEGKRTYFLVPRHGNTRAVGIDFGGSLGDLRSFFPRKLDGKIHISKFLNFFRYRPSTDGPPPYGDQIVEPLSIGTEFFNTLARYSTIDSERLKKKIEAEVDSAVQAYGDKTDVLYQFAQRIGAPVPKNAKDNSEEIAGCLKIFLCKNFTARQAHAKQLFQINFCRLNAVDQRNLLGSNSIRIEGDVKQNLMVKFFDNLRVENPKLFTTLDTIEELMIPINLIGKNPSGKDSGTNLSEFKDALRSRISKAYLKGTLDKEADKIERLVGKTKALINQYEDTFNQLEKIKDVTDDQTRADLINDEVNKFTKAVAQYEKENINTSTQQKFVIAACALVGGLLGVVIGAAIGLAAGGLVGGGLGSVAPIVGNIAGAVAGGSIGGIIAAVKGAGLGALIGAAVGAFFLGAGFNLASGIGSRYMMFSSTDKISSKLTGNLEEDLKNKAAQPISPTDEKNKDNPEEEGALASPHSQQFN